MSKEQIVQFYAVGNNVNTNELEIVELDSPNMDIVIGKHAYINGEIVVDPDWVEPPTVETNSIPVSDPGVA